jgi:hypothetical protein
MTIARLYSYLASRTSYLKRLRQIWQRQTSTPPQEPVNPLYALALAVAEQYGLD